MTLIDRIRAGELPEIVRHAAAGEPMPAELIAAGIAAGKIALPANALHPPRNPRVIGAGLSIKVNANIGTSPDHGDIDEELRKLQVAEAAGADAVMDLSTGPRSRQTRRQVLDNTSIAVGTVPLYEAFLDAGKASGSISGLTRDHLFNAIEEHGRDGVDFVTLHCGLTRKAVEQMMQQKRVTDIVSRGGALLVEWMIKNDAENPLYEDYGRVMEICRKYDMTISLGDGMRPGSISDATDRAQIQELLTLGELAQQANEQGVGVMIEGPGHVPLNQIKTNMQLQKRLCNGAPFYVLGPLVTDIAPGYDHITSAIGGAIAATCGADFLCYVTPAEHLRLPTVDDVRNGVIASKIAAHAADIANGLPGAAERDLRMSRARKKVDWEGMFAECLDPETARRMKNEIAGSSDEVCSMCGNFCAMKTINDLMKSE